MTETRDKRKTWYDKNAVKREFRVRELVLVLATSKPNKMAVQWTGSDVIESKLSETNCIACFNCNKPLAESEIVAVERGSKTLIDSSIERNDGYVEYLKDRQSVTIHVQCRKRYTRKTSIAVAKRQ
ncbi:hypothetical protein AVEN_29540-1 [Araneus ventricosus]|uniref:Uncharacterized protein n=1 Tax=Araneus ventricosus TaxID=182803 RepID=A0A4Y2BA16_ARAVE|nr:hypothetical protein AVEN_29540-1 [Araneus ventricosus]